jgi:hypothetical protein
MWAGPNAVPQLGKYEHFEQIHRNPSTPIQIYTYLYLQKRENSKLIILSDTTEQGMI